MRFLSTIVVAVCACSAGAQECGTGRYSTVDFFPAIDSVLAVPYGSNTPVSGTGTQTLLMDVYMPAGDTLQARPVVLCAFGGSFLGGARADVAPLCRWFARMGYVAVAPDYRVGFFFPNTSTTAKAVVRSMHDIKGCVRFLRKSVVELANPYGIDPDRIIIGGVSAGAIGALHATYMDHSSEILPVLYPDTAAIGGIEGNSGSPGYSSAVLACYSFSGALGDTSWIAAGDPHLCSVHETGDPTVPYGTQEVAVIGIPVGLYASGSSDIHKRLDHLGIINCFLSYDVAQHVGYLTYDLAGSMDFVTQFCAHEVCGQPTSCGTVYAGVHEQNTSERLGLYPNPASDHVRVEGVWSMKAEMLLIDATGRSVMDRSYAVGKDIDVSAIPNGAYHLLMLDHDRTLRASLIVAH